MVHPQSAENLVQFHAYARETNMRFVNPLSQSGNFCSTQDHLSNMAGVLRTGHATQSGSNLVDTQRLHVLCELCCTYGRLRPPGAAAIKMHA